MTAAEEPFDIGDWTFVICHCDLVFPGVPLFRVVSYDFVDPFCPPRIQSTKSH